MGKKRDRKPARITEYAEKEVKDLGIGSMTWVKQCPASGKTGARNAKIVSLRPLIQWSLIHSASITAALAQHDGSLCNLGIWKFWKVQNVCIWCKKWKEATCFLLFEMPPFCNVVLRPCSHRWNDSLPTMGSSLCNITEAAKHSEAQDLICHRTEWSAQNKVLES